MRRSARRSRADRCSTFLAPRARRCSFRASGTRTGTVVSQSGLRIAGSCMWVTRIICARSSRRTITRYRSWQHFGPTTMGSDDGACQRYATCTTPTGQTSRCSGITTSLSSRRARQRPSQRRFRQRCKGRIELVQDAVARLVTRRAPWHPPQPGMPRRHPVQLRLRLLA